MTLSEVVSDWFSASRMARLLVKFVSESQGVRATIMEVYEGK